MNSYAHSIFYQSIGLRIYNQSIPPALLKMFQLTCPLRNFMQEQEDTFSSQQWQKVNSCLERKFSNDSDVFSQHTQNLSPINILQTDFSLPQSAEEESLSACKQPRTKVGRNNYEKNIIAYVVKKVVQCFIKPKYQRIVRKLCSKFKCSFEEAQRYYRQKNKDIFGITHLTLLITAEKEEEIQMKRMFATFFEWFLREKYMFYLLSEGKMSNKEKYIEFKNTYLLNIQSAMKQTAGRN